MSKLYLHKNLLILFGVTLSVIMGVSSIMPVLPTLMRIFGVDAHEVSYVITAFAIPGIITAPLAGILADRIGRKKVLMVSMAVFGVFGTACAMAPNFSWLLFFRFFQGLGAGPLGVLNSTILGDLYSGQERAAVMGYNASVLAVGTAGFPAIGGLLALLGWRAPFFLPLLAMVLLVVVWLKLDNPEPGPGEKLSLYFKEALAVMLTRRALGLFLVTLLTFLILYGCYVMALPILLKSRFDCGPHIIGLIISSSSAVTALAASQLGRISRRFKSATMLTGACLLYAFSLVLMPNIPWALGMLIPVTMFGLAQGLNVPNLMTLLAGLAPMRHRAAVMAANGMILRVGQSIAPFLAGAALTGWGAQSVFYFGVGVAGCMLLAVLFMIRPGADGNDIFEGGPEHG